MEADMKLKTLTGAALLLVSAPLTAHAGPQNCLDLRKLDPGGAVNPAGAAVPNIVYVTGSSALKPVLAELAPILFASSTRPSTIVYLGAGSCNGINAKVLGTPMVAGGATAYPAYWDVNSTVTAGSTVTLPGATSPITLTAKEEFCTLAPPLGTDITADIGASDVFAQSCGAALQGLPAGTADFQGPIQSMTFAVNKASKENAISAEAAYLVFGVGTLAPWTDPNAIYIRDYKSGTQQMIATAIGVPASATRFWLGKNMGGSGGVAGALVTPPPSPQTVADQAYYDRAIGILAADFSSKPDLKQLAYQHYGQRCGYKPDVAPLDKRNTREGRYAIWGPIHLLSTVDGSGFATKPEARDLIAYLTGTQQPPLGVDLIRAEVALHIVPPCAMKVQRKSEMGPMTPYKPALSCGCKWDKEATGTTTCTPCATNAQCGGTESCNFGYCEKQ
jgi:ABC-type phosphate transport system substrate-binding protein